MHRSMRVLWWGLALAAAGAAAAQPAPEPAGIFKLVRGGVTVERGAQQLPATVGMPVYASDRVATAADGSAGITFADNTLMSLAPSTRIALERFQFNRTTHEGAFETRLRQGKLAVVSGKIAKQTPDAMKLRTPTSILGVRGTEFLVEAAP